jgi:Arc/MetJ-type ribon-helix-helix transcriptional regulator
MIIDLQPDQQRVIDLAIQSGTYQNADEVLDQAFEIIREHLNLEHWMIEQGDAVAAQIAAGFEQAERGTLMDGEEAIKMLRQRRAGRDDLDPSSSIC